MKELVVGVDVGGTNVRLGLVGSSGVVTARSCFSTKTYIRSQKHLIAAICSGIKDLLKQQRLTSKQIEGIGVGLPGLIDPPKGQVIFLPNVPGWRQVPLKRIIEKNLRITTHIENDVNLITLGEWMFGAGQGLKDLICITLGTGVGGGLILNGSIYRGPGFAAGEIGHVPLNETGLRCSCGGKACLERYVGNEALQRNARRYFRKTNITLEEVHARAVRGEKKAIRFWENTGVKIGNGLVGMVNLLNPARIIIGGGVANSHRFLFKHIQRTIKARAMKVQGSMVRIVRAKLGNDAGVIGARVLVERKGC